MTEKMNYKKTKYVCYYTNLAMASAFCLPPILFTYFRDMYGLSFTLLGTLIVANFCTQLLIDLTFSFFGKYFNPHIALRVTPLLTGFGLIVYALIPTLFPQSAYAGLVVGTIIFSVAAGLAEVLVSPTVEALPSDTHAKDMAILHSLYGYGVVIVIAISSVYLLLFGGENWMYLCLFWAIPPIIAGILLFNSPLPAMNPSVATKGKTGTKATGLLLCAACIFFGSCAENVMMNWISGYLEISMAIPKILGDIFGMMLFAVLLSLGRTMYAKRGKNIYKILLAGMAAATACYLIAGLSPIPVISLIACAITGIATSMLWPGSLIYMSEKIPTAGVAAFALMAAGGDLGASLAPELLGIIADAVSESSWGIGLGINLSITPDQLGMKVGMLTAAIFPLLGVAILLLMKKYFKKHDFSALKNINFESLGTEILNAEDDENL